MEKIYDGGEYFDMNKQIQLREKLPDHNIQVLLQKFITKCTSLSKKYNISEYLKQANISLLDLAKDPDTTAEEF